MACWVSNHYGPGLSLSGRGWPGTGANLTIGTWQLWAGVALGEMQKSVGFSPYSSPADEGVDLGEVVSQHGCLIPCRESGGSSGHSGGAWCCARGGALPTADP